MDIFCNKWWYPQIESESFNSSAHGRTSELGKPASSISLNLLDFAGDDCISIVSGSSNIKMKRIYCGPGHGIRFFQNFVLCGMLFYVLAMSLLPIDFPFCHEASGASGKMAQ